MLINSKIKMDLSRYSKGMYCINISMKKNLLTKNSLI